MATAKRASGTGSTRVELQTMKDSPSATGLELLQEQRSKDTFTSADPAAVPQGPYWGAPPNMPRLVLIMLACLGLAGLIWLLKTLDWLLAPTFLALNLVIVVYPVQTHLMRRGWPKWLATLLAALALVGIFGVLVFAMFWAISSIVNEAPQIVNSAMPLYHEAFDQLAKLGMDPDTLNNFWAEFNPASLLGALPQVFSSVSGVISVIAVVFSMIIMMVLDVGGWEQRMMAAGRSHSRVVAAMRMFSRGIRKYWLVSTCFGIVMTGLNYAELLIVGAPLPYVWMLLTFITTYIPSVGFFFAMVPPVAVTFAMNGWQDGLLLLGMYLITTWVVQGVFQPMMTGDAVGINATVSLLSLLFWAWVFGPLGALIALPCTLLAKSLLVDADPKARWVNSLLSNGVRAKAAAAQS